VEEGIVPGGGVALIRSLKVLEKATLPEDEHYGLNIVKRALEEPLRQIANNAGFEGSVVVEKVKAGKDDYGFDADKGEYCNMIKAGIIDPTKVTRLALLNATSVSSLLMTTEAMVADVPKKKSPQMLMPPPGGMGGMGGMGGGMGGMGGGMDDYDY
jgi:chaperonin GroEL